MSRPSMPARFRADMTWLIFWALARMASCAVAASVWTPSVMVAMSGATSTSPMADRFSVVARNMESAAGVAGAAAVCAMAAGARAAAAAIVSPRAPARIRVFIELSRSC
ncbi:MAG: hypothetical protein A2882_11455 [Phenylobacterium sp. RIFCSPHIGHO2_01_FULL_70_10]|nr:MAG: hypothetical protein A2882_11455 [Phenylobacterium sp. RIFCSPHIGHO2_01_FULL_70_10]